MAKKKTQRKKQKKANNNRIVRQPNNALVKSEHVHAACSITDPFCSHARAAKRPDGLGAQTFGYCVKGGYTLTTDANGELCRVFAIGGKYGQATCTNAAGTWTVPANWAQYTGFGFVDTNAAELRIVSAGIRFISTASATNCSGVINMFTMPQVALGQTWTELSRTYPETYLSPLTSGKEVCWISKPTGSAAHSFRPRTEWDSSTLADFNWTTCVIEISGAPASTTMGYAEFTINVEFTPGSAAVGVGSLAGGIPKPRPANPTALTAQSHMHSSVASFFEGGVRFVEQKLVAAAENALKYAATAGLAMIGM